MSIQIIEASRPISGEILQLMLQGCHPLLAYYASLQIRIKNTVPIMLVAPDSDSGFGFQSESRPGSEPEPDDGSVNPVADVWEFEVLFQGDSLGIVVATAQELRVPLGSQGQQGQPSPSQLLEAFADCAAHLRLEENPDFILPPAQCLLDQDGQILWQNGTFLEIQRLVQDPLQDLMQEAFDDQSAQDFDALPRDAFPFPDTPLVVLAEELTVHDIDMLALRFPIPSREGKTMFFMVLSSDMESDSKSAVIKEIHHRVKNNLQTIASLLRLQMRRLNSKKVERAFSESINRISSIALIHEELSRGGIDKINIKSATANIMEMVLSSMVPPGKRITGELFGSEIYLDADKAGSLSLCITELLQNSVEHAFPMRKKGVIKVDIREQNGDALISICDNGIGFSGRKARTSMGLEIIDMITVEKLKGTFTIEGHMDGTISVIRFPQTHERMKQTL